MDKIPIIGFSAYSGVGKTTLIEKLIVCLKSRGLRVAVIKHDGHNFEIDREGKDSWRFTNAGADLMLISSERKLAYVETRSAPLSSMLSMIHDVELVLVEGHKDSGFSQIGILRKASGKGLPAEPSRYAAVVTDDASLNAPVPVFGLEQAEELANFIIENLTAFSYFFSESREAPQLVAGSI